MTEPSDEGGRVRSLDDETTCRRDGNHWVVNGARLHHRGRWREGGHRHGEVGRSGAQGGACMFLVDLPDPAIRIDHVPNTIDSSMPGGHATVTIDNLRIPADQMLGEAGEGFKYAQVRLSRRACRTACAGWAGASAPTRSRRTMPTGAWPSASR
jgi:acyl-CoA dehydrogenase